MSTPEPLVIALTATEAGKACGVSARTVTDAHDRGDLIGFWLGSKRLYQPAELVAWVTSLPTQKPTR